jgi:hypothetical protein
MEQKKKPLFEFRNQVAPRYIEPLFLQIQYDRWYDLPQLVNLLHNSGLDIDGTEVVNRNVLAWDELGLGIWEKRTKKVFKLTPLGKQLIDTYSTNKELFYDLMHFLFYSAFPRSNDISKGRFWLYTNICNTLWQEAPTVIDTLSLTNRLQVESREAFPDYDPSFSNRSVNGIFHWLKTLAPPFLSKPTNSLNYSKRRSYCTPQLFHLATDMVYNIIEGVQYGASISISDQQITEICKICLLDTDHFWEMANLTSMTIRGYEIHQGQWGTSISLVGPPDWITLPDFSDEALSNVNEFDDRSEA